MDLDITESIIDDLLPFLGADLFPDLLLGLEAVFLLLFLAVLLGLVAAHVLLYLVADGTQFLLLGILAHLTDNGFALLGVGVLLGLLWSGADLQLTLLHSLV